MSSSPDSSGWKVQASHKSKSASRNRQKSEQPVLDKQHEAKDERYPFASQKKLARGVGSQNFDEKLGSSPIPANSSGEIHTLFIDPEKSSLTEKNKGSFNRSRITAPRNLPKNLLKEPAKALPKDSTKTLPNGSLKVPPAVAQQLELCQKYRYQYKIVSNGNIQNNSTLYVQSNVAHPHQIQQLIERAINQAKTMPEIFGPNFECDCRINHVQSQNGKYMGYAWIDLSNPAMYYALIGKNVDGSERAEYIDDPDHVPVKNMSLAESDDPELQINPSNDDSGEEMDYSKPLVFGDFKSDWKSSSDNLSRSQNTPPKIRIALPPLITVGEYEYDEQQRAHFDNKSTHGSIKVSPGYINPGVPEGFNDRVLYVQNVPEKDYDFLYTIFGRYARTDYFPDSTADKKSGVNFYPKIKFRNQGEKITATIEYTGHYDAAYALCMSKKTRAIYRGQEVVLIVRQYHS